MCTVGATETSPSRQSAARRSSQSATTIIATTPADNRNPHRHVRQIKRQARDHVRRCERHRPGVDVELFVDAAHMVPDRVDRDAQLFRGRLVTEAVGEQAHEAALLGRERGDAPFGRGLVLEVADDLARDLRRERRSSSCAWRHGLRDLRRGVFFSGCRRRRCGWPRRPSLLLRTP